jgi:catechol 2,3-dioxygenase-like lactoylglutathione lyase family enzyme
MRPGSEPRAMVLCPASDGTSAMLTTLRPDPGRKGGRKAAGTSPDVRGGKSCAWARPQMFARRVPMIDHVGFPVSDYARSKAFYSQALAPLGYALIMEVGETESGSPAVGFGRGGKPDFWIGGEGGLTGVLHIAMSPTIVAPSTPSTARRSPPAVGTTARPACGRTITRTITAPSCSIPTATISRRCATRRPEGAVAFRASRAGTASAPDG